MEPRLLRARLGTWARGRDGWVTVTHGTPLENVRCQRNPGSKGTRAYRLPAIARKQAQEIAPSNLALAVAAAPARVERTPSVRPPPLAVLRHPGRRLRAARRGRRQRLPGRQTRAVGRLRTVRRFLHATRRGQSWAVQPARHRKRHVRHRPQHRVGAALSCSTAPLRRRLPELLPRGQAAGRHPRSSCCSRFVRQRRRCADGTNARVPPAGRCSL